LLLLFFVIIDVIVIQQIIQGHNEQHFVLIFNEVPHYEKKFVHLPVPDLWPLCPSLLSNLQIPAIRGKIYRCFVAS